MTFLVSSAILAALLLGVSSGPCPAVTLGISPDGRFFTIDGKPTFLNGISYYGALTISTPSFVTRDLDDMAADGINWIRVWAYWGTPGTGEANPAATTSGGTVREPYMGRLKTLIMECNKRGIIVDVTMNRKAKGPGPTNVEEHIACARKLAIQLKPFRNVYIDIANERDVRDARYVSYPEMGRIIDAIKQVDPSRLCTASGTPGSQDDLDKYLTVGHCDFICPHLCRDPECPSQTVGTVRGLIAWMDKLGRRVPIHLQEPFRRGYTPRWNPEADDYYRDCTGGKIAEAAGWCLHNGSDRDKPLSRSFLMDDASGRLYSQLDSVEKTVSDGILDRIGSLSADIRRYQAEYDEQLPHEIGRREGEVWSADPSKDSPGYLSRGPCIEAVPAGNQRVTWRLMIDEVDGDDIVVLTLDVVSGSTTLAKRDIRRREFTAPNSWQTFSLDFAARERQKLELRTYWHGNSRAKLDWITLAINGGAPAKVKAAARSTPN